MKMEKERKIKQYRERLDKTLASPDLTNKEILKTLVRKQLLRSSEQEIEGNKEEVIETRTSEVSEFLDMLRSASVDDDKRSTTLQTDWKLKQDSEEFRVMYREGPEGTPFHTLLVEGYVDGPVDVCLCLSWETSLYKKWWPQITVPSFKVILSETLQKIHIGEQISIMRVNCWPLSPREAIVHYYLFEYFQDDLIVVLLNTVSEPKSINEIVHGFNNEAIPEAKHAVRIDVVGGFALQKVTSERSYFRTIANMDIKLDFVPPSLINFISRQLIGSGFRLYQKAVASKMNHDTTFSKAIGDPLYARIRESLFDINGSKRVMNGEEFKQDIKILPGEDLIERKQDEEKDVIQEDKSNNDSTSFNAGVPSDSKAFGGIEEADDDIPLEEFQQGVNILSDEDLVESKLDETRDASQEGKSNQYANKSRPVDAIRLKNRKVLCEIEEGDSEEIVHFEIDDKKLNDVPIEEVDARIPLKANRNVCISSDVEQALQTLGDAISVVRKYGFLSHRSSSSFDNEEPSFMELGDKVDSHSPKPGQVCSNVLERTSQEASGPNSVIHSLRPAVTNPNSKEVNHNKVVPASQEQNLSRSNEASQVSSINGAVEIPVMEQARHSNKQWDVSSDGPKKSKSWKKYLTVVFRHK